MRPHLALLALSQDPLTPGVYSGAQGSLSVAPPRIESVVKVDGILDEPVWERAARLTDFSQYSPTDGQPARNRTEVLVWYSPTAIHFGVRAAAEPGTVRARLADRDRGITPDDYVEIHLGTFNDRRQAFVFAVNPLGVQADGALAEGSRQRSAGFEGDRGGREAVDLSPDYVFDSRGRLTALGYEVEVRIPFRSLRYPESARQSWSLQVVRKVAAGGHEDTWAPARRAAPSFVAQGGTLTGIEGIRRGLVLEFNPVVTSTVEGSRAEEGWRYGGGRPEVGANAKLGLSTDITLNGTVNPDFSQVESDAGQVSSDPRRALFFGEKRPFFLDGLEYFTTPSQVIYTRRIAAPVAAVKLAGKMSGTSFGLLSAVDGTITSASGADHPFYNVLRVQREIAGRSRLGLAYTDRIERGDYNRVGEVDGRLVLNNLYSVSFIGAMSRTRQGDGVTTGPLWYLDLQRTGRTVGFQATFSGVSNEFHAASGFISQGDLAEASIAPSFTIYGKPGALVQRFSATGFGQLAWAYTKFRSGGPALDRRLLARTNWNLRGGWDIGLTTYRFHYGYDERLYRGYGIEVPAAAGLDTVPYRGGPPIPALSFSLTVSTPEIAGFMLNAYFGGGKDLDYDEFSAGRARIGTVTLSYRPTQKLRFQSTMPYSIYHRWSDGTLVSRTLIPRLRTEYQLSRAVFVRLVGEYRMVKRDSLRDDTRTERPILIRGPDGVYRRGPAQGFERNDLELDFLFSYQPTPGTVLFAGYGSSMVEDAAFRFRALNRTRDAFFTKLSYLFRL